jgi:hypothetical protein
MTENSIASIEPRNKGQEWQRGGGGW